MFVRPAVKNDYEKVEALMRQVNDLHVAWRPDVYKDAPIILPEAEFLNSLGQGHILVAENASEIVGVAIFVERKVSGNIKVEKKTLFVDTMAVLEGHRGQGIGHALFDALETIAREKDCEGIELQVNARNQKAMEMYKGYGFQEKSINMEFYF